MLHFGQRCVFVGAHAATVRLDGGGETHAHRARGRPPRGRTPHGLSQCADPERQQGVEVVVVLDPATRTPIGVADQIDVGVVDARKDPVRGEVDGPDRAGGMTEMPSVSSYFKDLSFG